MNARNPRSPVVLVGLVSSFREGRLIRSALASLAPHVDRVYVLDGPFGEAPAAGEESQLDRLPGNVVVRYGGAWADDAAKRTELVRWAASREQDIRPVFGFVLDGDELLVNGEWVRDFAERARPEDRALACRIVEWDGTVVRTFCRILRVDLVERFELGAFQVRWVDSPIVHPFPNYVEVGGNLEPHQLAEHHAMMSPPYRAPLQGEPHVLHRNFLRPDDRFASRASQAEVAWADRLRDSIGI